MRNVYKRMLYIFALITLLSCNKEDNEIIIPIEPIVNIDSIDTINFNHVDSIKISEYCSKSPNYGKTVGVFGGSYSVYPESNIVKDKWRKYLNMNVTDYGVPGYGFSSLQGSIQNAVDKCEIKDIYILWCSTNDFYGNRKVGDVSDYTNTDDYNINSLVTQCGGINYCIKKLKEKNSKCKIYLFTTMQNFYRNAGYDTTKVNSVGASINQYVKGQIDCCRRNDVQYLNLLEKKYFNINNYAPYYREDHLHLNKKGYEVISGDILQFVADLKNKGSSKN